MTRPKASFRQMVKRYATAVSASCQPLAVCCSTPMLSPCGHPACVGWPAPSYIRIPSTGLKKTDRAAPSKRMRFAPLGRKSSLKSVNEPPDGRIATWVKS